MARLPASTSNALIKIYKVLHGHAHVAVVNWSCMTGRSNTWPSLGVQMCSVRSVCVTVICCRALSGKHFPQTKVHSLSDRLVCFCASFAEYAQSVAIEC
jgi:hypothetical protein